MLQSIGYDINYKCDAPKVMSDLSSHMGSVSADRQMWANVIQSLGGKVMPYLRWDGEMSPTEACESLVVAAIPQEGEIHPVRATYTIDTPTQVTFGTPGAVELTVAVNDGAVGVDINFNRSSRFLATQVVAAMIAATGDENLYPLLIKAASPE